MLSIFLRSTKIGQEKTLETKKKALEGDFEGKPRELFFFWIFPKHHKPSLAALALASNP